MKISQESFDRLPFGHLSSLFSPTVIRRLATHEAASSIREIIVTAGLDHHFGHCSLRDVFEGIYDILRQNYRCEYIYKNAIASKILLGRHSPQTSGLLTEVQVGPSKADLVLINGETTAYEIKTELDSLDRLNSQLASYQAAFDRVYVVSYERCLERIVQRLPLGVGLLCLTSRYTIATKREATADLSRLDSSVIFDILRRNEYTSIIKKHFGYVPRVPNTLLYRECRSLFLSLHQACVRNEFAAILKRRAQTAVAVLPHEIALAPHSLLLRTLTGELGPDHYRHLNLRLA
ncbi:MAG TPA: sce7726 family protein [Thermoanaerobaculia bacterium]|nr:sce7726 family protein [Thermoanaerobaculia bacterium]